MSLLPKEIESHYLGKPASESGVSADQGELERLRTEAILARHSACTAVVVDVGAGGELRFPACQESYEVHLIDAVELHRNKHIARGTPASLWRLSR